jgi:hypothetical protein
VSPDDIDQVTGIWRTATADRDRLAGAVADRLTGTPAFRASRAEWILRSVSSLAPVLDHPAAFAPAAAELIAPRFPVTLDELAVERDALLGALEEICGALTPEAAHAWDLAFGIFAEIVCSIGLDPFGCSGNGPQLPAATAEATAAEVAVPTVGAAAEAVP